MRGVPYRGPTCLTRAIPLVRRRHRPSPLGVCVTCVPLPEGGDRHRGKFPGKGTAAGAGSGSRYRPVLTGPGDRRGGVRFPGRGPGTPGRGLGSGRGLKGCSPVPRPRGRGGRECHRAGPVPGTWGGGRVGGCSRSRYGRRPAAPRCPHAGPRVLRPPVGQHHPAKNTRGGSWGRGGGARVQFSWGSRCFGRGCSLQQPGIPRRGQGLGSGDRNSASQIPVVLGVGSCPSVCASIPLSIPLSVSPSIPPFVHLPLHPFVYPSFCPSIPLSVSPSAPPSIPPSVSLSLHPSTCPSVCPSIRPSPFRWLWAVPMAEKTASRVSDHSWVLAGSEVRAGDTLRQHPWPARSCGHGCRQKEADGG